MGARIAAPGTPDLEPSSRDHERVATVGMGSCVMGSLRWATSIVGGMRDPCFGEPR